MSVAGKCSIISFIELRETFLKHHFCIRKYNIERDKAMKRAKEALEEAFTPQLRKMLENKMVTSDTE